MNQKIFRFDQFLCRHSHHGLTECNPIIPCGCGKCIGISLYILANLYECESENLSPEKAFELTEMYVKMLKMSRDPMTLGPTAMGNFSHLEQIISTLQMKYQSYEKYPFGDFIYSFDSAGDRSGFALTYVYSCFSNKSLPYNHLFLRSFNDKQDAINTNRYVGPNHVGFIVWRDSSLFIFDPNIGGGIFKFSMDKLTPFFIEGHINLLSVQLKNPQRVRLISIFKPRFDLENKNKHIINNALKDIYSFKGFM
ncbi:hypothetical protein [Xenorhabdus lircayensis]|uniref:Uncharacterized protein n=1 Tax=Xenorhabdus lircayensis TaxID=2763499 RepID=A0ABS0U9B5_9GAMM|nr:hypothetical protein [Xenorhabdus lircayensis]MBI6550472.1 hypothetical protein [Xenorhabdus lircayensis]